MLEMLKNTFEKMGYSAATESLQYINAQISRISNYNKKLKEYPELRFYPVGHPRKLIVEKRNECYNSIIQELRKWNYEGETVFNIPHQLRPHQETVTEIREICRTILLLEKDGKINEILRNIA